MARELHENEIFNLLGDGNESDLDFSDLTDLTDSLRTLIVEKGPDHIDANYYYNNDYTK